MADWLYKFFHWMFKIKTVSYTDLQEKQNELETAYLIIRQMEETHNAEVDTFKRLLDLSKNKQFVYCITFEDKDYVEIQGDDFFIEDGVLHIVKHSFVTEHPGSYEEYVGNGLFKVCKTVYMSSKKWTDITVVDIE